MKFEVSFNDGVTIYYYYPSAVSMLDMALWLTFSKNIPHVVAIYVLDDFPAFVGGAFLTIGIKEN